MGSAQSLFSVPKPSPMLVTVWHIIVKASPHIMFFVQICVHWKRIIFEVAENIRRDDQQGSEVQKDIPGTRMCVLIITFSVRFP